MDLEGCPEQISDKVFQDEHSALPGKLKGGWMGKGGKGGRGLVKEKSGGTGALWLPLYPSLGAVRACLFCGSEAETHGGSPGGSRV